MSPARRLADTVDEELWFGVDDPAHADRAASESLAASVANIAGLKPFPAVAQKVLIELNAEEWNAGKVSHLIESDPSLASMVLRMTNSSFYRRGAAITSIRQGVVRLGRAHIREMVAGAAAMQLFQDASELGQQWRDHCASVAAIVRTLAKERKGVNASTAFLAGLLHDVGKMLLLETGELDYTWHPEALEPFDDVLVQVERSVLSFDHAVLGGHVLQQWGLPEPVPQLVAWHHQAIRAWTEGGEVAVLISLLRLADRVSGELEVGEVDVAALGACPDASYLEITQEELQEMLPGLMEARVEALEMFRG